MARQLMRRGSLVAAVAGLVLPVAACTSGGDSQAETVSTCDLLPRTQVAAALALPGQSADDLELSGGDYDPKLDGTSPADAEIGPLFNECLAGDPSVATIRVTSLVQDAAAGTVQDVVGNQCSDLEPFPDAVDAVGGTCLGLSTEARGRWQDQRIVVQLYRVAGPQASDRTAVTEIAERYSQALANLS